MKTQENDHEYSDICVCDDCRTSREQRSASATKLAQKILESPDLEITYIYRYFDYDGDPIYIGMTNCFEDRNRHHFFNAPWYVDAFDVEIEAYPTRRVAEVFESRLINMYLPKGNIKVPTAMETPPARDRWFYDFVGDEIYGFRFRVLAVDWEKIVELGYCVPVMCDPVASST